MEKRKIIIAYAIKHSGDWSRIFNAIRTRETLEEEDFAKVDEMKCSAITLVDEDYPAQLREIYKPPLVLFYYGEISLLNNYFKNVSIVGSRDCSEYGANITYEIASGLAQKGYTIVSGMARGIDGIAHRGAIDGGGRTIAVLGSGIDYYYPAENKDLYKEIKENHLVISEYPGKLPPQTYFFPVRNRIIAGLSKTLVVTEAKNSSGSLITAALALGGDADVMCVPHEAGKQSQCNQLINSGAILVESADDVIKEMSMNRIFLK